MEEYSQKIIRTLFKHRFHDQNVVICWIYHHLVWFSRQIGMYTVTCTAWQKSVHHQPDTKVKVSSTMRARSIDRTIERTIDDDAVKPIDLSYQRSLLSCLLLRVLSSYLISIDPNEVSCVVSLLLTPPNSFHWSCSYCSLQTKSGYHTCWESLTAETL